VNYCSISGSNFAQGSSRIYRSLVLLLLLCVSPLLLAAPQANLQPSQIQLNNLTLDQLEQAADAGDPDAQYALGYMYYYGKGVSQNTQTALNWMKRAAVQGQSQAMNAMALLGQSVPAPQQQSMTYSQGPSFAPSANAPVKSAKKTPASGNITTVVTTTTTTPVTEPSSGGQQLSKASAGHYYTIQLLGASSKGALDSYINTYNLQGNATYYQTKHQGKNWYVLVYGNYKTHAQAQTAIATLPAAVRAKKPWVKLMGNAETKTSTKSTAKKTKSSSKKSAKTKDEALPF